MMMLCTRGQVVKLRVVASDCGHPPLSTSLNVSVVINHTLVQDHGSAGADIYSTHDDDDRAATDGRRRRLSDPTNVLLVGAACGSGLVMFTAILTAVVFALRTQHRRRHADAVCCYCCTDNHGPLHQPSACLFINAIEKRLVNRVCLLVFLC